MAWRTKVWAVRSLRKVGGLVRPALACHRGVRRQESPSIEVRRRGELVVSPYLCHVYLFFPQLAVHDHHGFAISWKRAADDDFYLSAHAAEASNEDLINRDLGSGCRCDEVFGDLLLVLTPGGAHRQPGRLAG